MFRKIFEKKKWIRYYWIRIVKIYRTKIFCLIDLLGAINDFNFMRRSVKGKKFVFFWNSEIIRFKTDMLGNWKTYLGSNIRDGFHKKNNTYWFIGANSCDCWPFVFVLCPSWAKPDSRHLPFSPFRFLSSQMQRNSVSMIVS